MQKKWLVVAGIALAVVALVIGAVLTKPKAATESPSSDRPAAASQRPGSTVGTAPASSGNETPTVRSSASKMKTVKTPPSATGGNAASPPADAPLAGPVPPGDELKPLTRPPAKTLAMLDEKAATPGSKYSVTFQPYGLAASNALVIYVAKSEPVGRVTKPYDFAKRNVLVRVTMGEVNETVSAGGTYTGTIELREEGGLLTPYLLAADGND